MTPLLAKMGILVSLTMLAALSGCRRQPDETPGQTPISIITKTGVEMVLIPAGTFIMGDDEGEPDERPAHRVKLDAFFIDRYEVVQAEFKKHRISDPSHFKSDDRPLEQINWTDAALYCNERSLA
ncbi:MAG: SUMF1/EgtB/PvdO family nonheme iron enzyme, partial [Phycisphaerae bacterium]|nr:SUMF1/EgtB/PvdO family nonheme iron enzyme [Phycisphaerae bacterium]